MENKKKNSIKILIVIVIFVIILGIAYFIISKIGNGLISKSSSEVGIYSDEQGNNILDTDNVIITNESVKVNISPKMIVEKKVKDYIVSDMSISAQAGKTTVSFKLVNNSEKQLKNKEYTIKFLNEKGRKIGQLTGVIENVGTSEETYIYAYCDGDYSNAYDYNIEF